MGENTKRAKEIFLGNPLITASQLAKESHISIEELRELFSQLQSDTNAQKTLKSWGPARGYYSEVMRYILSSPKFIENIYHDEIIYPKILELHLGQSCPCACIFCYSKGKNSLSSECSNYRSSPDDKLLNTNEVLSIVNKSIEEGCEVIYFSGGLEPFASNTTIDVLHHLPKGIKIHIFTNGVPTILNDEVLEFIVERVFRIRFSIHAVTADIYSIVQMPHRNDGEIVFQRVIERVKKAIVFRDRLRDAGKLAAEVDVTFLTVPQNYIELEEAIKMWSDIGIDRLAIGNDVLEENPRTEILTKEQKEDLRKIFRHIENIADSDKVKKTKIRASRENVQSIFPAAQKCYAPLEKAVIDPYGRLWTCCMRAHPFLQSGNFYLGLIRSGEDFQQILEQRQHLPSIMRNVPLGFHCRECTEYEYVANICIQKLLEDLAFGIALHEQPFKLRIP